MFSTLYVFNLKITNRSPNKDTVYKAELIDRFFSQIDFACRVNSFCVIIFKRQMSTCSLLPMFFF